MSDLSSLFSATEQRYRLPPGILAATARVESSDNPAAVSPQGAVGLMQLLPSTAQGLGVDPRNIVQAVDGAGRLWAQNLKASGGDIDRAAMMYHGGNDPRNWGPKTQAYPGKLAAALGPAPAAQPEGGDPIEAALSGHPVQASAPTPQSAPADPNDPIESALAGGGQDRQAEIAAAQAQASKQLAAGDEKGAIATLAAHNLQMAPGELDAYHAGKRSSGFNYAGAQQPQPEQINVTPQTNQALGFLEGLAKPIDNAAVWLEHGANAIGIGQPISELGADLGLAPSAEAANATHQAYFKGQEAQGQTPGAIGKFAGELAGTLPAAIATKNPWIAGGISGALTTDKPNDLGTVLTDAGLGAVGGKVGDAVIGGIAGAVAPKIKATVQALHDLGVTMTPGQIVGGAVRRIEDAVTSIPLLGDVVKNAQRRSVLSLNTGVINDRVLAPIGAKLPDGMVGREAVNKADELVSNEYDKLLPKLSLQADQQFVQNSAQILQRIRELPPERAQQVENIIKGSLLAKFDPAGRMSGTTFQSGDEKLGQLARQYGSSPDPEQRAMGGIFRDVQGEFRDLLERSNPQYAGQLRPIRQAFANLVRVEGAAGSAGARGGVFTPSQLAGAVRRFDTSARKKAYATGKALMQDVSDAANEVLPQSLPDSGTPYRTLLAYALGAGAGATAKVAAPAAIPVALYTRAGQKAFQAAALAPRGPAAKALARGLSKLKAPATVGGGYLAAEAANGR